MRGSTLKKWKHQLKKKFVGGKDNSRTRSLVASYRWPSLTPHLFSFPNASGECCATDPKGRSLFCSCQNVKSEIPNFHSKRKMSSHADPGLSLGKAATEAREGTEVILRILPSLRRRGYELVMLFLFPFQWPNHLPTPTTIIPELKLTWNRQHVQMRFWSDAHFKHNKKQICFSVNKIYNHQVRTITLS